MQIKTGPFLRSPLTIKQIMIDVLIALTPAVIAGLVFFGLPAFKVLLLSSLSAILTEALILRAPLTPRGIFGDGSAAVTGLLVGLILPSTVAWWVPIVGSVLAIALVKWAFGGLGHNIFNPALGARAILLLAFTSQLVKFTAPFEAVTAATPLLSTRSFSWSLVWGNVGGSIGETSVIAILLGAAYLLYKGHINWRNPVGYVGSAFILALLWGLDPWYTITAGGLLFAAVFMATDMVTSPVTPLGQLIFGIGCGLLTMVIRQFTSLPEGVTFAVLTMNALAPAIESLTIPRIFGLPVSQESFKKGIAVTAAAVVVFAAFFVLLDRSQPPATPVFSYGQYLPIGELLGQDDYEVVDENGTRYYLIRDAEGNPAQTAFVAEQGGFNGPIRFLMVLDAEHRIQDISVLEHREDPGLGELATRPEFLAQFVGLDKDSSFTLGVDIQAVSGATISSRALLSGVQRALEQFDRTFFPQEEPGAYADGTYYAQVDSFGGPLELEVVVAGGRIAAVNVLAHSDTPGISDPAYGNVPQRIVQANSPQVEAASGATVSSQAIMKAVEQALMQAAVGAAAEEAADLFAILVEDGTYRASANGFGGELVIDVTVEGGKITDIEVVESQETPFIADAAFKALIPAIIEAQGPVDAASGATFTSKALLEAVEKAVSGVTEAPEGEAAYLDGIYRAQVDSFGGTLELEVVVEGGRIAAVNVLAHSDTPGISDPAYENVPQRIVQANSPQVEIASGATVSSKAIMAAVEQALAQAVDGGETLAAVEPFTIAVEDGTYRASADGFGGELVIDVTVEGGKITDIEVVESQETPFIADTAFKELIPAIIEAQGPVETVSGATFTSKALLEAVEKAVSGVTEAPAEPFAILVEDGAYRASADGFGGELVIDVTVEGGKITDIEVVESQETPFIADTAFKELIPAIIEAQGPVEAVSGATFTSKALLEAVEKAVSGVTEAPEGEAAYLDGIYRAQVDSFGGTLELEVVVEGGRIAAVNVLAHSDTPGISDPAYENVPQRIVQANSPQVEIASGATVSSKAIMAAVEQALAQAVDGAATEAAVEAFTIAVDDGTYRASADGFGGELVIDVTVEGGKITDIEVVESQETPFIADTAFKELIPAIIEAQGPVEAVSGATFTSKALLEAVEKAVSGVTEAPEGEAAYLDGIYRAQVDSFGGTLELEVVVEGGRIAAVNVLAHSDTPGISDPAYENVPQRIVQANSPQVEIASGATVSSKAIMAAVEQALAQAVDGAATEAAVEAFTIAVDDGTYRASADGFGGELVIDVTVEGGKITDIEVVESQETPFIADTAFKELIPAIIEAQGPVEAVSGATFTSKALLEAVDKAVSGVTEASKAAEPFAILVEDGTYRGSADGFGGELVIDVTVEGGKITNIEVVQSEETPFIADTAFKHLIPAIIETQGPVEAVSGATFISQALEDAVRDALRIKEGQ
ncbi:MAG: RnfABCDGE type electron transport complex subunit D [Limnochordia bacterium]|jgi:RnfABCDGE-type electron transport complex D subunit|nr:RnfABCDGE type electron transport complex subunit D [Limnochordia bacterium]